MTKSRKLDIFNKIYDLEYLLDPSSSIEENAHILAGVINVPIKAIIKIMLENTPYTKSDKLERLFNYWNI